MGPSTSKMQYCVAVWKEAVQESKLEAWTVWFGWMKAVAFLLAIIIVTTCVWFSSHQAVLASTAPWSVVPESLATCGSLDCGSGNVPQINSSSFFCAEAACDPRSDASVCCQARANCSSLMDVKPGFRLRLNASHILCAGAVCDALADSVACYEPLATCDSLDCGSSSVPHINSPSLFCA